MDADRRTARARAAAHLEHLDGGLGELRAAAQEGRKSRIHQAEEEAQLWSFERAPIQTQELGPDDFGQLEHVGHPAVVGIHAAQVQRVAYRGSARGQCAHGAAASASRLWSASPGAETKLDAARAPELVCRANGALPTGRT